MGKNTLIISDTQAPYHHQDALKFLDAVADDLGDCEVVHIGDLIDGHALSRFHQHPDAHGAGTEVALAKEFAQDLYRRWPTMKICRGNHDERILTVAERAGIPSALIKSLNSALGTHRWRWAPSWQIRWAMGTATCYHGARKKGAINRAKQTGTSIVCGHWHSLYGVEYFQTDWKLRFGMDVGTLSDKHSPAMAYSRECMFDQIMGTAAIKDGWPRLYPMLLDQKNRWTGKIV